MMQAPFPWFGGYAKLGNGGNINAARERIWFSPHCMDASQGSLL